MTAVDKVNTGDKRMLSWKLEDASSPTGRGSRAVSVLLVMSPSLVVATCVFDLYSTILYLEVKKDCPLPKR